MSSIDNWHLWQSSDDAGSGLWYATRRVPFTDAEMEAGAARTVYAPTKEEAAAMAEAQDQGTA